MPERNRVNVPQGAVMHEGRKPKLGQHFLAGESDARRIVEALGDVSEATVLEIGPGTGALTCALAATATRSPRRGSPPWTARGLGFTYW